MCPCYCSPPPPAVMVQLLNEADCLGAAVSIMRKHVVSSSVQCRGCILIRLLCHAHFLHSKQVCSDVARVVVDALFRKTDRHVQIEVGGLGDVE